MSFQLNLAYNRITNVSWDDADDGFLYSGADGMFGSADGAEWFPAPASVPATSLAYMNDVWVGSNRDVGSWRSTDGAQTWTAGGPAFIQVVSTQPPGKDAQGKPLSGRFIGWEGLETQDVIHTSEDGETWTVAKTIENSFGATGYELVQSISACGGRFFIGTIRGASNLHNGDGMLYTSSDGISFDDGQMVFGPGTEPAPGDPLPFKGYLCGGVGFDEQSETYIAIGLTTQTLFEGETNYHMISATGTGGSFSAGEGTQFASSTSAGNTIDSLTGGQSAAGGAGQFATGYAELITNDSGATWDIRINAALGGSPSVLTTSGPQFGYFFGSFCFLNGTFACVAFGTGYAGGVYIADVGTGGGGSWGLAHSGSGIAGYGAVAVGKIGFPLTEDEEP